MRHVVVVVDSETSLCRLGVKAKTCKAKAKDLTFKAKGLIPEANVGYRKKY